MYRLTGAVGEKIILVQNTTSSTISILFEDGTIIVNAAPTIEKPPLPLRFYNFTPAQEGTYLIRWNGATPELMWEVIDIKVSSLRWIARQIKKKTDNLPSAKTG